MELVSLAQVALQSAAEHAASYRLGQSALRHLDRALSVVEKCARWAVPPPLDQDERPQPELVRPLPWVFFLALLVTLRVTRESISLVNLVMGKPPLRSADVVTYIQGKRRYLRTLKYQGGRMLRTRSQTPSGPVASLRALLQLCLCFRHPQAALCHNNNTSASTDEIMVVKRSKRRQAAASPPPDEATYERLIEHMMIELNADSDDDSSFTLTNATSIKSDRSDYTAESDQDTVFQQDITTTEPTHSSTPTKVNGNTTLNDSEEDKHEITNTNGGENSLNSPKKDGGENTLNKPKTVGGENTLNKPKTEGVENTLNKPQSVGGENTLNKPKTVGGENTLNKPQTVGGENTLNKPQTVGGENTLNSPKTDGVELDQANKSCSEDTQEGTVGHTNDKCQTNGAKVSNDEENTDSEHNKAKKDIAETNGAVHIKDKETSGNKHNRNNAQTKCSEDALLPSPDSTVPSPKDETKKFLQQESTPQKSHRKNEKIGRKSKIWSFITLKKNMIKQKRAKPANGRTVKSVSAKKKDIQERRDVSVTSNNSF